MFSVLLRSRCRHCRGRPPWERGGGRGNLVGNLDGVGDAGSLLRRCRSLLPLHRPLRVTAIIVVATAGVLLMLLVRPRWGLLVETGAASSRQGGPSSSRQSAVDAWK